MCKILCVTDAASCREDLLVRLDKVCAGRPDAVLLRAKDLAPDETGRIDVSDPNAAYVKLTALI